MKLSGEQIELQDVTRRFLADRVTSEYRRARVSSHSRGDASLRESLRDLGLEEGFSGSDGVFSWRELALIAEECGRSLLPEPLVEHLLADCMAPRMMNPEDRARYESISGGSTWSTIAPPRCCALTLDKKGVAVSGSVAWCAGTEEINRVIAFAQTKQGCRAVALPAKGKGLKIHPSESLDLTASLYQVELSNAPVVVLSEESTRLFEDALEILKASEVSGVCQQVMETTVEYVKTREQFGVPVGSFQAVQQKLADVYAALESLRALARFAAWSAAESPEQRRLTARSVILHAAEVGPRVCEVALQAHGGIGFTWEYDLHLFLRRVKLIQAGFGWSEERADALLSNLPLD